MSGPPREAPVARHGLPRAPMRPWAHALVERLSERVTLPSLALVLGALLLAAAGAGAMDARHRAAIRAEGRAAREPTDARPWRYDI